MRRWPASSWSEPEVAGNAGEEVTVVGTSTAGTVGVTPPAPGFQRVRMTVAYDGTDFRGFADQPGVPTVAGALVDAITQVSGEGIVLACAGRTDAGVHAWGQVVSFDLPVGLTEPDHLARLATGVTKLCSPSVVVREIRRAPDDFDARHSAISRTYRYSVLASPVPDPFRVRTTWHVPVPLDLRAMTLACDPFIGEHDFASFCRAASRADGSAAPLVRRVLDARWVVLDDDVLQFRISASSFCHQMVRAVVGTLVEVGRGRRRAGEIMGILAARDRQAAGQLAPPCGLSLWEVGYP